MTQDEKKRIAAEYAISLIPDDSYIGVGTGSTVNFFIEALANIKDKIRGAVPTSHQSADLLRKVGVQLIDIKDVDHLPIYIDGADEVNHTLQMVKGGGGALMNEKIVAAHSRLFVCIADDSKYVSQLGEFPLAVEVLPHARKVVTTQLIHLGGFPELRLNYITENGNEILDVTGLNLNQPVTMEDLINRIPGVMENGLFAHRPADILVLGTDDGVKVTRMGVNTL